MRSAHDAGSVRSSSTLAAALTSGFVLFMIITLAFVLIVGITGLLRGDVGVPALLLIFAAVCLPGFLWPVLTRSFEVSETGIEYREAFRTVSLTWQDIEAVHIEPWKGQITFWVKGKKVRIHTHGLDRATLREADAALANHLQARQKRPD